MNLNRRHPKEKYARLTPIELPNRQWPNKTLSKAPLWCSVDLRDGNQALITPMNLTQKIKLFNYLVAIGFKHIEVGFPSASTVEFEFVRYIIEHNLIPNDVSIQVLTQSREHLIKQTLASIEGAHSAIVHLYNSTSLAQRNYVFNKSKDEITQIALDGVDLIKQNLTSHHSNIILQYSQKVLPEQKLIFQLEFAMKSLIGGMVYRP